MIDKIRWGILSTARINRGVISEIRKATRIELVAVASRTVNKVKKYALERNIPKLYGSYKKLLKASDIDVVYLPLPNSLHYNGQLKP